MKIELLIVSIFLILTFQSCNKSPDTEIKWYNDLYLNSNTKDVVDTLNGRIERISAAQFAIHLFRARALEFQELAMIKANELRRVASKLYSEKKIGKEEYDSMRTKSFEVYDSYIKLSIQDCDTILKYDSMDLYFRNVRYNLYATQGFPEIALVELSKMIEITQWLENNKKTTADIWENRPWFYNAQKVYYACNYSPTSCDLYQARGKIYCEIKEDQLAISDFNRCAKIEIGKKLYKTCLD